MSASAAARRTLRLGGYRRGKRECEKRRQYKTHETISGRQPSDYMSIVHPNRRSGHEFREKGVDSSDGRSVRLRFQPPRNFARERSRRSAVRTLLSVTLVSFGILNLPAVAAAQPEPQPTLTPASSTAVVSTSPSVVENSANTAVGVGALIANTSGYYNAALGVNALRFNTDGFH